jgi:hypothetical protein
MEGEKPPQIGPQTTHGFPIFLTFLFSPLSVGAIQNHVTGKCRSGTRSGSGPLPRTTTGNPPTWHTRKCRRQPCRRHRSPGPARTRVSGMRTSCRYGRRSRTGSARYRPGRLPSHSLDHSIHCKGRRCSSLGILPCPACKQGPADSRLRLGTSNSRPACKCDPACRSRKRRRRYRSHSSRFRAGSCRIRRSTHCKELRRCSSPGTRRWSCCTLVPSGNRWPRRTPWRRFHRPSGPLQSRIHLPRRNRHRCPLRRTRRQSRSRKLRYLPPPLRPR